MTRAAATAGSPREELLTFPRNTRFYAEQWLATGQPHPSEHWLINEKLSGWRKAIELAGLREEMAAEVELAAPAPPKKPTVWIVPSGRCTGLGDEPLKSSATTVADPAFNPSVKSPTALAETRNSAEPHKPARGKRNSVPGARHGAHRGAHRGGCPKGLPLLPRDLHGSAQPRQVLLDGVQDASVEAASGRAHAARPSSGVSKWTT